MPPRSRPLTQRAAAEISSFGVVGAICLAGDIILFNFFAFTVGMSPLLAKSVGMVITGAMAFFGHRHVTFRHRGGGGYVREVPLFVAVTLATVVLSLIPLYAARYLADLTSVFWLNVANLSGIALGTIARYVAYKGVVWKHVHGTHHAAPAENRTVPPAENRTVHLDSGDGLTPVDEGPSRDHVRSPRLLEVQHELVGE